MVPDERVSSVLSECESVRISEVVFKTGSLHRHRPFAIDKHDVIGLEQRPTFVERNVTLCTQVVDVRKERHLATKYNRLDVKNDK